MAPGSGAADAHKGVEIPVTTSSAGSKDTGPDVDENSDSCFLEWLPVSCWSIIVDELAAKDLLCLSMTSKVVSCQLGGVPGLWTQACSNSLGMHSTTAAACSNSSCSHTSHAIQPPRHSTIYSNQHNPTFAISQQQHDDQQAQQILSSLVALAHTTGNLKPQLKPQSYLLPPWLGAQPGKARGFVRVESPAVLNPGLVLTEAQVYWLSWGCLSGHSGGVFVTHCTSSPRSRQACGFMAAVVINKQLLAELYLPSSCTAPSRWSHLHHPSSAEAIEAAAKQAAANDTGATSSQAPAARIGVQFELWVSQQVSLESADDATTAEAECSGASAAWIAAGQRGRSRRRQQDRNNSNAARSNSIRGPPVSSSGVPWHDVHALLMECINSNAARVRAVAGTALVPPGTATAAEAEQQLAQLLAAGAPVLDLRRMQYTSGHIAAAGAAAQSAVTVQSQGARVGRHAPWRPAGQVGKCNAGAPSSRNVMPGQVYSSPEVPSLAVHQLAAMQQLWQNRTAAVQAAVLQAVAETATDSDSAAAAGSLDDDSLAEVLAAVIKQLHQLAPEVQVLVLPVILPGGRVGQRLPGGKAGGSRLSAPRLLSLNVPYLVPLRYEWDKLQQLKQVLLMVGPPAALPAPSAAGGSAVVQSSVTVGSSSSWGSTISESKGSGQHLTGSSERGRQLLQRRQQPAAGAEGGSAGPMMRGVFSQQELEQEWQQQALVQEVRDQQQQQQWDEEAWFEQQLGQQQLQGSRHIAGQVGMGHLMQPGTASSSGVQQTSGVSLWGTNAVLPGYAVEAVQGMLLSCMDRLALGPSL